MYFFSCNPDEFEPDPNGTEYDALTAIYLANPENTLTWEFDEGNQTIINPDGIFYTHDGLIYELDLREKKYLLSLPK